MSELPIPNLTISDLQPQGLYNGAVLNFSLVNYFIGKNCTGKTQIMQRLHNQIKDYASQNTQRGTIGKFLPTNRTHSISGNREMLADKTEQWEINNPTADAFFQFLNESEFTKAMVQSRLNYFFEKSIRITPRGRNIVMDIFERWRKREEGQKESAEELTKKELKELNLSSESDGMKEMLILLTYIYHPRVRVIAIDEAELHLHPQMINFIFDAIEEAVQGNQKQFFIVTHSPVAIRLVPESTWKYFFFDKRNNKVIDFNKFSEPSFSDLIPQLNSFRRETFYSDRVILVEGEQDYQMFHNLSKRIGYSETDAGGYSFFPCWGGYELERLYNFFHALNKEIFIIADANIENLPKANFSDDFKKILADPKITTKLSVNDIVLLCKEKDVIYSEKTKFNKNEKREIIRAELKRINSGTFNESDYQELIKAINNVLGEKQDFGLPEELQEMFKNLVADFQTRFASREYKDLFLGGDMSTIKKKIRADEKLTKFLQDADGDKLEFVCSNGNWNCVVYFSNGKQRIKVNFNKTTDHSEFQPTVEMVS